MATEKKTKKTEAKVKVEVEGKSSAKQKVVEKKSDEVKALQEQEKKRKAQEKKPSGVQTTAGNIIRHAEVKYVAKAGVGVISGAMYGKLIEGKKGEDAEKNLRKLPDRRMAPEAYLAYQRNPDKAAALEAAVRSTFPMHADDKAYGQEIGKVNGNDVNYVRINYVTKDDVEKGFAFENQIGKVRLLAGIKGEKEGRVNAILTPKEVAMWRHRAEVTGEMKPAKDKDGNVKKDEKGNDILRFEVQNVGAPITKLQLAEAVAQRQVAARETRANLLAEAKGIDWSQYKAPIGAKLSKVHPGESNEPDRLWINGDVNNTPIKGVLLTPMETLAIREKIATSEQVFMHNAASRKQAFDINKINYMDLKAHSEELSVKAIAQRAADPSAGARFTKEQVDIININLGKTEDREGAVMQLFEKAQVEIKKEGVDESWLDAVKDELKEVASNQWKEKSESVSMGR